MSDYERCWSLRQADPDLVLRFHRELRLHPVVARVLVARGVTDESTAQDFLSPRLANLLPPTTMAGIDQATERVGRAVLAGELVGVFGDYDVDGISSSVLVADYLRRVGGKVTIRVARRDEGYGFGVPQAMEMVGRGCTLLVLTDCGTSDHAAVAAASREGLDIVAVDHHQVTAGEWPGLVLVNPQRPDCAFPFKGLTSVGLAFYLVASLRRFLERNGHEAPDPRESLDLVALGTVADVAPLEAENRILVSRGLIQLGKTRRPGLRELMRLAHITGGTPTSDQVSWRLAPRLNAPGRLGDASVSLECMWQQDPDKGVLSARHCDALNEERRSIQAQVEAEALGIAEQQINQGRSFLLVAGHGWHPGVIGIVAGRLVSAYGRPAAVVALEEGRPDARGSARSIPSLDLVALLRPCAEHMVRFGGHAAAAGFSVMTDHLDALHQMLDEQTAPRLVSVERRRLWVDGVLELAQVDLRLCRELLCLGPHGCNNPEPVFAAADVVVESARAMGEKHLRLRLRQGQTRIGAVGFGLGGRLAGLPDRVDIAFSPEYDDFHGPRVRLRLTDIRAVRDGWGDGADVPVGEERDQ